MLWSNDRRFKHGRVCIEIAHEKWLAKKQQQNWRWTASDAIFIRFCIMWKWKFSWSRKSGSIAIITTSLSCDDNPSAASRRCNSKITTILEGHVTRIMCLKLKNSRHWNLLKVPIHLTRPRTLLNCFQQCSLTVKLLGNLFVESEKQHIVVYLVWLNTSKSCSKTVSVDILLYCLMKAKTQKCRKSKWMPCEVVEWEKQPSHYMILQQWLSWRVLSLLLWTR